MMYYQGDIIKIEGINQELVVVSKDIYNKTDQVVVCLITKEKKTDPLAVEIMYEKKKAYVLCDQIRHFDLFVRGSKKVGEVSLAERLEIADVIQALFEY